MRNKEYWYCFYDDGNISRTTKKMTQSEAEDQAEAWGDFRLIIEANKLEEFVKKFIKKQKHGHT